ncbi:MAG: hypothetical protein ABII64_10075 [Elusimicrobiota bacterium]
MMKKLFALIFIAIPCCASAAWISATPEVQIEAVTVGRECNMRPLKFPLFVKNKGNSPVTVTIKAVQPEGTLMRAGYEPLPLLSRIVLANDKMTLMPGEKKTLDGMLFLPRNYRFLEKKYQFHVFFKVSSVFGFPSAPAAGSSGIGVYPGVESVILVSTLKEMAKTEIEKDMDGAGGEIEDPDVMYMNIPPGALSKKTKIKITELAYDDIPKKTGLDAADAVLAFKFEPEGTIFKKPVKLKLYYSDFDNDGIVDKIGVKVEDLKVFYWNGYRWELIGGKVDVAAKTVEVELYHFSVYGVFPAAQSAPSSYIPQQKIITPANMDGKNDFISFPGLQGSYSIDIFDITGMRVITLGNKNIWYGLDEDGNLVESGAYIYKYDVDINGIKKTMTGVVVVAK